ncbi:MULTISPECIES: hypothetical protein [unclassified Paenibacillus]|uniref:hypothetical protein n=1 Tax=unclassified Paenibacillus TaxID=185978 RepID=UPI00368D9044
MSLPSVPNITPTISVTSQDAYNLLLISIALEEIGLSHIVNAEAEKIQYALGTLPGLTPKATLHEILQVNKDVRATLGEVVLQELILHKKLGSIFDNLHSSITPPCPPESTVTYPPYR